MEEKTFKGDEVSAAKSPDSAHVQRFVGRCPYREPSARELDAAKKGRPFTGDPRTRAKDRQRFLEEAEAGFPGFETVKAPERRN